MLQQLPQVIKYHLITIIVVVGILLTILINKVGTYSNRKIALRLKDLLSPCLKESFSSFDGQMIHESENIIKIYPSGRQSCLFAIVSLALIPRQQILSFLFNGLFFRLKDEIVVEIPVNTQHTLSLTAAIVQRKQIKTITKKNFPDVKQLCKEYKPKPENQQKFNVPSSHSILVEKLEHVKYFINSEKQTQLWKKHGKSVKLVYISDVNKFSRYPMAVRMVMYAHESDLIPMLEWLLGFVDRMAKVKMSPHERKQSLRKRQTLNITYQ